MLGRKWRTGVMTKQSSGFRVSSSSAQCSSPGATARRQPSPSCQSQGKIAHPTFGVGWRRNPKPERFQPRSTGGVDRCVGIPSSFTGESGTSSPSSCGCTSPRSCAGCQGGRCQSWPRSTSRARRRARSRFSIQRPTRKASSQSQGPLIQWSKPQMKPKLWRAFPGNITLRMALVTLDDPCAVFRQRAAVMKSVPHVLRGHFPRALKLALEETTWGNCRDDEVRQERRWKLITLLPRMSLHRPPGWRVGPANEACGPSRGFLR